MQKNQRTGRQWNSCERIYDIMDKTPHIVAGNTYCDPNKKVLKEWIWKHFDAVFMRDHSITNVNNTWVGFWVKSGTNYYAIMVYPRG